MVKRKTVEPKTVEPDPDSPEGIRSAAERALEAQRGKRPSGFSYEVDRFLRLRSAAFARATQGRDAPGKRDSYPKATPRKG